MQEQRQAAGEMLNVLGAQLRELQLYDRYYELLASFARAFDIENIDDFLPEKQEFVLRAQQMSAPVAMPSQPASPEAFQSPTPAIQTPPGPGEVS